MSIVPRSDTDDKHGLKLMAEHAREYAAIHRLACRYRAQGLTCSTCSDLNERAARLTRLAQP